MLTRMSWQTRYWSNVNKNGRTPQHCKHLGKCWEWTGYNCKGHGRITVNNKEEYAHRIAWKLAFGTVPHSLLVCHKCDNRGCQNPKHLFLGTQKDNMIDAWEKGRLNHPPHVPGEKQGQSKLTAEKVIAIRNAYSGNRGDLSLLGREYGVTPTCILLIVNRTNWRHIP